MRHVAKAIGGYYPTPDRVATFLASGSSLALGRVRSARWIPAVGRDMPSTS